MPELDDPPLAPPSTVAPQRRKRRWWIAGAVVVVLLAGVAVAWWVLTRPPRPVSVNDAVNKFRTTQPTAPATARPAVLPAHPPVGVYVYATKGSERVSAGIVHHYPKQTTVTISVSGCGLQVRWDALAGRRSVAQLCVRDNGWQLVTYTDVHKFLYMEDVHSYACDSPTPVAGGLASTCRGSDTVLTSTVQRLETTGGLRHVRVVQHGTGKSTSNGTIDAWLLPNGLPQRLDITDHGAQVVLGSTVTYDEKASFTLTSQTPRR